MEDKFMDVSRRKFTPMPIPGLTSKAREAVNASLDALSAWRNETAETSEKNGKEVIDKMAAAAKALGWPDQVVDVARTQIQSVTAVQIKTMDQIMDVWEEQLKLPDPSTASTSALLSKLTFSPGLNLPGSSNLAGLQTANPMQIWMQFAEQWQKSWADTMATWAKTAKPK